MKNKFDFLYMSRYLLVLSIFFALMANEAKADILNGSFDNAGANWITTSAFHCTNSGLTGYRTSPGYAWFAASDGSPANNITGTLSQSFTMPTSFNSAYVDFYTRISTD